MLLFKKYHITFAKMVLLAMWMTLFTVGHAQDKKLPVQITDMLHIKSIRNLQLHPDGNKLLFEVKSVVKDPEKKRYDYLNQIWQLSLDAKDEEKAVPLTAPIHTATDASYSPDGAKVVFSRTIEGKPQLFLLDMSGGEAQQLTSFKFGASKPIWSPDGKTVVFSTSVTLDQILQDEFLRYSVQDTPLWSLEKPGLTWADIKDDSANVGNPNGSLKEIRAYLHHNQQEGRAKVINRTRFQTENDATDKLRFTHYYRISLDSTGVVLPLAKGFRSYANLHFWGDDEVVVTTAGTKHEHPDKDSSNTLVKIDIHTLDETQWLNDNLHQYALLAADHAQNQLVFSKTLQNTLAIPEVFIWNLDGSPRQVKIDRSLHDFKFADEGKTLYFVVDDDGGRVLTRTKVQDLTTESISPVDQGISDYVISKEGILAVVNSSKNPAEIKKIGHKGEYPTELTNFNASWLAHKQIADWEQFTYKNDLGQEVSYWLIRPVNHTSSSKVPLLVQIHGGPASMFGPADATMWLEYQFFAANGYAVLLGNPRGSTGYGTEFLQSNYQDWGEGPARDVLKAVDLTLEKNSWIDPESLYLTGGSYGGYLTTWILAHDARFKAASSQRGVYDLATFFGEGNVWPMVKRYFGGYPWENGIAEVLRKNSVLEVAHNIHTPLLIFHGEQDLRTGIAQSERLYKTLKVLRRDVEYVRHPGANHEITRSGDVAQRIDQLLRTYEFFQRYQLAK